jgi:hypothetical protein
VLISDQTPWLNLQEKKIGWDLPLSEEVWVNILDGLHKIKDSDYNDLSKSSLNFAVNYRYESGLVEKVKNLFE